MAYAGELPPKKNAEFLLVFPIFDNDGDPVTGAAGLAATISKDGGTAAATTNSVTEIVDGTATGVGMYQLTLTATEMNADVVEIQVSTTTTDAKTTPTIVYTSTIQLSDIDAAITGVSEDITTLQESVTATAAAVAALTTSVTTILDLVQSGAVANVVAVVGAGFTLAQMYDLLTLLLADVRLSDGKPFDYTPALICSMLNRAQTDVYPKLNRRITPELDLDVLAQTITAGAFDLSTLTYPVDGDFDGVYFPSTGMPVFRISYQEYMRNMRAGYSYTEHDGAFYQRSTRLYFLPDTATSVDLFYRRAPRPMLLENIGIGQGSNLYASGSEFLIAEPSPVQPENSDCELSYEVQYIILEQAAAHLFRLGRVSDQAEYHQHVADLGIVQLNARYPQTDTIQQGIRRTIYPSPLSMNRGRFNIYTGSY